MIHLKAVYKKRSAKTDTFPFNIPAIKALERVEFHQPITFLVGENGSGKSTFLEALAAGVGAITVGGKDIKSDQTLAHAWRLAAGLRLVWYMKTKQGFFMRAKDWKSTQSYFSKTMAYIGKDETVPANLLDKKLGRHWGYINKKVLDSYIKSKTSKITQETFVKLRDYFLGHIKQIAKESG